MLKWLQLNPSMQTPVSNVTTNPDYILSAHTGWVCLASRWVFMCSTDFSYLLDTLFIYFFPVVISCQSKHYCVRQSVSCGGGRLLLQTIAGKIWPKTPQKTSQHKSEGYLWADLLQGCLLLDLQHIKWLKANFPSPDNKVITSGQHHYQFLCLTCENVTMRLQDTI